MKPDGAQNVGGADPARPLISIVMPVLNGERYIAEAIQSVRAQTYPNHELVIVDDGSSDRTGEIVSTFSGSMRIVRVRHEQSRGIAASMNDGIRNATGEMIAFLDHDDGWFPEFLETERSYLAAHPEAGMVHCDVQTIDGAGRVIEASVAECRGRGFEPSGNVFPDLFRRSFICGDSVLVRKECFDRLGLFDEGLRWGDYHMWMRISRHYEIHYIPRVLAKYRQHASQSTRVTGPCQPDQDSVGLQVIKKILDEYPEARQELGEAQIRHRIASLYFDMGYKWWSRGATSNARTCFLRAIRNDPAKAGYYVQYLATLAPLALSSLLRHRWGQMRTMLGRGNPAAERLDQVWRSDTP